VQHHQALAGNAESPNGNMIIDGQFQTKSLEDARP
jgi:hypothetical protein